MTPVDQPELGQLWRSRVGEPSFIPATKFADEDKWADDLGHELTTDELVADYRPVTADDTSLARWWDGLDPSDRQRALDLADGDVPDWLVASLVAAGVIVPVLGDRADPFVARLPDPVLEFLAARRPSGAG